MRTALPVVLLSTPFRFLLPVIWMGVIFLLSHQPTLPYPKDLNAMIVSTLGHIVVYAVLAALLWWALGNTPVTPGWRAVLSVAIAALYGVTDEWHQSFVPGRTPAVADLIADTFGAAVAIVAVSALARRGVLDPDR